MDECLALCKNRSVFGEGEIMEMYKKRPKVIKLLDYMPFENKVTLKRLWEQGIVEPGKGPRTFDPITKEQFEFIYKLGTEK